LDAQDAASDVARLLDDEDKHVRYQAIRALEKIGPAAKSELPRLVRILEDPQKPVELRAMVAQLLGKIAPYE